MTDAVPHVCGWRVDRAAGLGNGAAIGSAEPAMDDGILAAWAKWRPIRPGPAPPYPSKG